MAEPQYTKKEAKLRVMPDLTREEGSFVQELISGASYVEAWNRAHDPDEKLQLSESQRKSKARSMLKKRRIRSWVEYLEKATPDELIEDAYVRQIAFGAPKEQLSAANAYLQSQFAGKEVAEIFLQRLQQIHAEIVIPCQGRMESVTL